MFDFLKDIQNPPSSTIQSSAKSEKAMWVHGG